MKCCFDCSAENAIPWYRGVENLRYLVHLRTSGCKTTHTIWPNRAQNSESIQFSLPFDPLYFKSKKKPPSQKSTFSVSLPRLAANNERHTLPHPTQHHQWNQKIKKSHLAKTTKNPPSQPITLRYTIVYLVTSSTIGSPGSPTWTQ